MSLHAPPHFVKLNTGKRLRIARPAAACLGALLVMSSAAYSQVPEPRVVAAEGLPDPLDPDNLGEPVWETWIAAGDNEVIAVYHQEVSAANDDALRTAYAIYDRATPGWAEAGIIPEAGDGTRGIGDPSIVWLGSESDEFVACSLLSKPGMFGPVVSVGIARFAGGSWEAWNPLVGFFPNTGTYDRPWILAGGEYPEGRELYITFWRTGEDDTNDPDRHSYLRSIDGGENWMLGDITFGIGGDFVEIAAEHARYQSAVGADGPLYMAYEPAANAHEIRFLEGVDVDDPTDPHVGEVEFSRMRRLCPLGGSDGPIQPLDLVITRNRTALEIRNDCLPGSGLDPAIVAIQTIPFLAADPGDPNQLYLVYHDTETDDPNDRDLNIYVHSLRRHSRGWCGWATRVRVNDDELAYDADQFLPQATVDDNGGLHVTWYDDRDYEDQPDGPNSPDPKFDMYYAYSDDRGAHWVNYEFLKDPGDPNSAEACLNYALFDEDPGFDFASRPGEYNGITAYGDEVWTCFTGTSWQELHDHPDHNPSVIWSSRIPLP